jgi:AraC-like DNA-binding protein
LQFYPRDTEKVQNGGSDKIITGKKTSVTGQHLVVSNRLTGKDFLVFQIVFQPGALYRITGIPANQLLNSYVDAENIFGKEIRLVNEQLYKAGSYREMVAIVEKYLQTIIRRKKRNVLPVDRISRLMLRCRDENSLEWFAKEACLSYRQFDRLFKERMGINPRLFLRIIQFDRAFRLKNKYPEKDWFTIAVHTGYYDYQHLSKAYKEFTGFTPTEFFKIESHSPERLFGDVEM